MSSDPILPWPIVRRGDDRFPVRPLQRLLRARGHQIAVDGDFGPQTEQAVKTFQQNHGLTADGIVGPQTWPRLIVQVKRGSEGEAVRGVQEVMRFHDQSGGEGPGVQVDGIFGPRTDAFVRGFQTALGLTSDGIVGPLTWRALVSGMLSG
jgi:peptidoglycan hydrolase-like protein with peptidoglycan-binding domain